ncbi:MAG: glycosyltransferase family 2 protein [Patescibacteria group bacterium]|nr:glycosyltransferase family 2 protein [Patescibacteria group bacterium]
MKKVKELSVFFPFWNEENNIEQVVLKAIPVVKKLAQKWEILMIDDGSSDGTARIGRKLARSHSNLRLISHNPNRGYGAALKSGLKNSKYDLVIFTDGDGQFDFMEASGFLEKLNGNDMVIGYRSVRKDSLIRHLLMMYLKIHDYILFGFNFKDIDCGFKLFTKKAIKTISPLKSEGAMITTEILARAKKNRLKIVQVSVNHYPRKYGRQSGANLRVLLRALKESLILWRELQKQPVKQAK